ncbi:MAG: hypothetical protein WC415_03915 [Patescibacteria group bacterium]|jgi:hypothetical protein
MANEVKIAIFKGKKIRKNIYQSEASGTMAPPSHRGKQKIASVISDDFFIFYL